MQGVEVRVGMMATETELGGWGNCPIYRCRVESSQSRAALRIIVERGGEASYIPRGLDRSLGDSALNRDQGVIILTGLNHFLAFDEATGVLECEAGVSLAKIFQHLLPRGWSRASSRAITGGLRTWTRLWLASSLDRSVVMLGNDK